jgi:NAD(P)-dependent dehydrogenase (short-subunit alcohol dehydrogenase family)
MSIQLADARQLSAEGLQVLRLRALRGIELGYSELELAELLGVCHETISRWWTAYCAEGLPALPGGRPGRPPGSGRFLSDQQAERIKAHIDFHSPEEVGVPHALWTRRAVRDLIRQELGMDLAERTVGLYLRRWGYTSKRPSRRARQQDRDEVEEWLLETYPAIEAQAHRGGSIVTITAALARNPIRGVPAAVPMITKGGLETITQHLAMEYAKDGIRVNAVAPGPVYTPLHRNTPKDVMDSLSPMGRPSMVKDIADAVMYLTDAATVTGHILYVDGGAHFGRW